MAEEHENDAPLTASEILMFGPCVESAVWTPMWLAERRAPIAQAAGRAKLGPVFNEQGVGKAVLIRPCVSRGRRVRGLPPIYTPKMLEANGKVFAGWPMYLDHAPAELAEAMKRRGRSVKELGGQVLTPSWDGAFVHEADEAYGYQQGAVIAEVWANEFVRRLVGENPDVLHTSISAWPTAGKPGNAPWGAGVRGMVIEGIRPQPQGSVDYVPRGGAGGRLLPLGEGEDPDTAAWPSPSWSDDDRALVVSVAESVYDSAQPMAEHENKSGKTSTEVPNLAEMTPEQLRTYVRENAPHLVPALSEAAAPGAPAPASGASALTVEDVRRIVEEAQADAPTAEQLEDAVEEMIEERVAERERHRSSAEACRQLIEKAEGIPASWKTDLIARYSVLPSGPSPVLVIAEGETVKDDDGKELSERDIVLARCKADLEHSRDLIAEATGRPRVKGEGGTKQTSTGDDRTALREERPYWRDRMAEMGIVESVEDALVIHGVEKAEG